MSVRFPARNGGGELQLIHDPGNLPRNSWPYLPSMESALAMSPTQVIVSICLALCFLVTAGSLPLSAEPAAQDGLAYLEDEPPERLAKRLLPENARLVHPPVVTGFGPYEDGLFIAFVAEGEDGGYGVQYLTRQLGRAHYDVMYLRRPDPDLDRYFDVEVASVFSVGPRGERAIVVLEDYSRPLASGGLAERAASLYRLTWGTPELDEAASRSIDGMEDQGAIKQKLVLDAVSPRQSAPAERSSRGVTEVFLALPGRAVPYSSSERMAFMTSGSCCYSMLARDEASGFLTIAGDAGRPGYTLKLLPGSGGELFAALQILWPDSQETYFMRRALDGSWADVSLAVLPDYRRHAAYRFSQSDLAVSLTGEDGRAAVLYGWRKDRFEVSKKDRFEVAK